MLALGDCLQFAIASKLPSNTTGGPDVAYHGMVDWERLNLNDLETIMHELEQCTVNCGNR